MTDQRGDSRGASTGFLDRITTEGNPGADYVTRLGPALVQGLFSASKTVQIHAMNNRATQAVLQRLLRTIEEFCNVEGRVTIAVVTDLLVINDVRLIVDSQNMGPLLFVVGEMKKRRVEEIDISPDITVEELGSFLRVFFSDPAEEDVFGALSIQLAQSSDNNIRLTEWIERVKHLRDTRTEKKSIQEESNKVMSRAVLFMGEVMKAIEQRRPIQVPKAHRLTQQMADIIQIDESVLVGLTSIKDYDEYTFAHSVNVSVLAMVIADRLGLPKGEIAEIGVAGLFHDIGKTHIPLSILNNPGKLDPDDWEFMKRHPLLGMIELSRVRSLRAIVDPLYVTLQHHVQYGGGGYPEKPGKWNLHPHTRIITVADVFDAMTTHRVYRKDPVTPDRALKFIQEMSGRIFDPLVARTFIRAMGVYPVGTVVTLDTGELAVVVRQHREARLLHRPFVALISGEGPPSEPVSLAERPNDHSPYDRSIVQSTYSVLPTSQRARCFITE